jgi:soluble lytic murein transglycosylase-like protein
MGTVAAQLASVRQQLMSVEVQRQSIAKQEAALYGMPKQTAFLELPRSEPQYVDCGALPRRETDKLIATAARTQSISADLLRAVIRQESAFRPCAVSDKGAQGLMQLMPATAAAFNVSDPFDPQQNILGGAAYLRQLMERYAGDASLALSAYNAGPQRVDRIAGIPDIPETQNYVTSIFRNLGWTLPIRPVTPPETGFGQTETDSDVTIEAIAPDVSIGELGPEQPPANPSQAKPPLPFFLLP